MKKKELSMPFIGLISFLVLVGSASYAYFYTAPNLDNTFIANVDTPASAPSFLATPSAAINITPTASELSTPSATAKKEGTGNISVKLSSPTDGESVYCQYDIAFIWDGTDQYTTPSVVLPYESVYNYELSIQGSATTKIVNSTFDSTAKTSTESNYGTNHVASETNLADSSLTWSSSPTGTNAGEAGRYTTLVEDAKIYSNSRNGTTTTWTFTMKFYVLPVSQRTIAGKNYQSHIKVINVVC